MTAGECWQAGDLPGAISAAAQAVKSAPTDVGARTLLAQFLCFAGEWERADTHLEAAITQQPKAAVLLLLRVLIRGEMSRLEVFEKGRVPDFFAPPGPALEESLRAITCLRAGDAQEAATILKASEEAREPVRGTANGEAFADFRDLDDRLAAVFEIITSTGKYLWLTHRQVQSIKLLPPSSPWELVWRRAEISIRRGPDGEVYVPCLYPGSSGSPENAIRLGRSTDWSEGSPVIGKGARMFLVGDEAKTLDELQELTFESDEPAEEAAETGTETGGG